MLLLGHVTIAVVHLKAACPQHAASVLRTAQQPRDLLSGTDIAGLCQCTQLGKPRGLSHGSADMHSRLSDGSLTDVFCGDGGGNAGPWAHPAKRRRCSRSNSAMSSQGELTALPPR
jgi:hypothetical protein